MHPILQQQHNLSIVESNAFQWRRCIFNIDILFIMEMQIPDQKFPRALDMHNLIPFFIEAESIELYFLILSLNAVQVPDDDVSALRAHIQKIFPCVDGDCIGLLEISEYFDFLAFIHVYNSNLTILGCKTDVFFLEIQN